ncbi:hypothetical protein MU582_01730 [Nocardioidaceae bacterium SCSIO 66511]|nr:hypothetical protein MU582_01730 [Nocardioidaceae bacterium SCSIO 66511]
MALGAALVLASGCTSGDDADPPEQETRIAYESGVSTPKDRDEDAVHASLARLDPCALIDPAGASVKGFSKGSEVSVDGPHVCEVDSPRSGEVRVVLGVELGAEDRYTRDLQTIGGAKAYVDNSDSTFCRVALPVSFTHVIEFVGSGSAVGSDACTSTTGIAEVAATRLEQAESFEQPEGPSRASACAILGEAVDLKKNREFRSGDDFLAGMDKCGVWEAPDAEADGAGLQFEPVAPEQYLEIEYRTPPNDEFPRSFGTVRGRKLNGYDSGGCVLAWNEWDGPKEAGEKLVARFQVSASKCPAAKRLVSAVTKVVDDGPPEPDGTQEPILYGPDEEDVGAPGGCVDLAEYETADCKAYADSEVEDIDLPSDGEDLVRAGAEDPQVGCAIALDAVREHFGDEMAPITAVNGTDLTGQPAYMCGFTEPTHSRQVWIDLVPEPMPDEPGSQIDGHDAHDVTTASEGTRDLWITIGDDAETDGHVYAKAIVTPDRSAGLDSDAPVDEAPLDDLDDAMTDVMAKHF